MSDLVNVEIRDAVLLIGINRADKRNAWNTEIVNAVCKAYKQLAEDPNLRVGLVYAEGSHFTSGLDLPDIAPALMKGDVSALIPADGLDPWDFMGEPCPKPIVLAVQGSCFTLGVELSLASQVVVAAEDTVFGQIEVSRGIFPFGGATYRIAAKLGNRGSRWMYTAEPFTAAEAMEAGLLSEVVPVGEQFNKALEIANKIAANAPGSVQLSLASQRAAERPGREAAMKKLQEEAMTIFNSGDAMEGIASMMERRAPVFTGK